MDLKDLVKTVHGFAAWTHPEKVKLFAWYLQQEQGKKTFEGRDILACYDKLSLQRPGNLALVLGRLTQSSPPQLLRGKLGYKLESRQIDDMDQKYGEAVLSVELKAALSELPGRIELETERRYLQEALLCLRAGAFRAAIVMTWNLAFDHLEELVIQKHLDDFNGAIIKRFPKQSQTISKKDDISEIFKESEVIEICRTGKILTGNEMKVLGEGLNWRNMVAHPSAVLATRIQAEHIAHNLVVNFVLNRPLN